MQQSLRPIMIMLEGNIGVGKSTFLQILQRCAPEISIVFEPTSQWQYVGEKGNLLNLFYQDTSRWAYTFQSYAFITRVKTLREHIKSNANLKKVVLERSIYCDRYCFAKNAHEIGLMSSLEWHLYGEWFAWLEKMLPTPHGFVYLQATPQVCFKRITKRNRLEEQSISLNYLSMLHKKHENWLIDKFEIDPALTKTPILVLDCNQEFENNMQLQEQLVSQVRAFAHELHAKEAAQSKQRTPVQNYSELT